MLVSGFFLNRSYSCEKGGTSLGISIASESMGEVCGYVIAGFGIDMSVFRLFASLFLVCKHAPDKCPEEEGIS